MTAALEGGEWSAARSGRTLPPGKTRYPLYRRLGGPQGRSGRAENVVPTGIRSRTIHPVVSRYTDWATGPTTSYIYVHNSTRKIFFAKVVVTQPVKKFLSFYETRKFVTVLTTARLIEYVMILRQPIHRYFLISDRLMCYVTTLQVATVT